MGCVLELTDACDGCCGAIGEGCSNCLGGLGRDESENFQNGKQIFGFWSYMPHPIGIGPFHLDPGGALGQPDGPVSCMAFNLQLNF